MSTELTVATQPGGAVTAAINGQAVDITPDMTPAQRFEAFRQAFAATGSPDPQPPAPEPDEPLDTVYSQPASDGSRPLTEAGKMLQRQVLEEFDPRTVRCA